MRSVIGQKRAESPEVGCEVPPGFSRNPTALNRRVRLAGLALLGLAAALYLSLYQVGLASSAWDPIFGRGTNRVLDLTAPVPDAVGGVIAYAVELTLLAVGGSDRWRTMPWVCLALGAVLLTGGAISVALILVQAVVVGAWCTLCLASAALSLSLLALGIGEARAATVEVRRARRRGASVISALRGSGVRTPSFSAISRNGAQS